MILEGSTVMKYFVVHGEYLMPLRELIQVQDLVTEHRDYVQKGYDSGQYLLSGPEVPADSGILIVRAESREKVDDLMAAEPFVREGKVRVTRVVEFHPARYQPSIQDWIGG